MLKTLHLAPGVEVLEPEDGSRIGYSSAAVERVKGFISHLCYGQNDWAGLPFKLLPWQVEDIIKPYYGVLVQDDDGRWVRYRRYLYVEIPKKNGKSELAAALGLYHLLGDGEKIPKVAIVAADKENASIVYGAAQYMVEHTDLSKPGRDGEHMVYCRPSVKEIRTRFGGLLKVYSADADTKHGYSFNCVIFDELHAQPNRKLWDVMTTGSDAAQRQQAIIVLTTAGNDPDRGSIGWEVHERCRKILAVRRGEPENELDVDLPQYLPIMYGIGILCGDDPDRIAQVDIWDENVWKMCNPSFGVSIKRRTYAAEAREAKTSPQLERNFRWLRLNQWISTKTAGWIPLGIYDKTQYMTGAGEAIESLRGLHCYGGMDLSSTTDLTAVVLIFPPQEGLEKWVALPHAFIPADNVTQAEQRDHVAYGDWHRAGFITLTPGDTVDFDTVEEYIWQAAETYHIDMLGFDPYLSQGIVAHLSEGKGERDIEPIPMVKIGQNMTGMSPATKELERLIRKHEMLHVHNTAARWCFGNVRLLTDSNENIRPVKEKSRGRIDIAVAWIVAMAAAIIAQNQPADLDAELDDPNWGL